MLRKALAILICFAAMLLVGCAAEPAVSPSMQPDADDLIWQRGELFDGRSEDAAALIEIDIDGDGKSDELELRYVDAFVTATLTLGTGATHTVNTDCWFVEKLQAADLTGDGCKELILMLDTGGNGGMGVFEIILLHVDESGAIKKINLPTRAENAPWMTGYDFIITYRDGFLMDIASEMLDVQGIPINDYRTKMLINSEFYDADGHVLRLSEGTSDGYYSFDVIRRGEGYALELRQYVNGADHADGIGDGISVLVWDGGGFALVEQSFELYE